jgi:hypothetical protein
MNPYEANARNIVLRLGVWLRGMARLYRRPLVVITIASLTMAMGVSAAHEQDSQPRPQPLPTTSLQD